MKCQRCNGLWGNQAVARLRSDIIDLAVCRQCAKEAVDLGLGYELLAETDTANAAQWFATAA